MRGSTTRRAETGRCGFGHLARSRFSTCLGEDMCAPDVITPPNCACVSIAQRSTIPLHARLPPNNPLRTKGCCSCRRRVSSCRDVKLESDVRERRIPGAEHPSVLLCTAGSWREPRFPRRLGRSYLILRLSCSRTCFAFFVSGVVFLWGACYLGRAPHHT